MQNHWLFSSSNIYFCKYQKADVKKCKEDERTLEELNLAHCCSQAKCQDKPVHQSFLLCHKINTLLTELSGSVWKNLDLSRVYRPHCARSVLTTSVFNSIQTSCSVNKSKKLKFSCFFNELFCCDGKLLRTENDVNPMIGHLSGTVIMA